MPIVPYGVLYCRHDSGCYWLDEINSTISSKVPGTLKITIVPPAKGIDRKEPFWYIRCHDPLQHRSHAIRHQIMMTKTNGNTPFLN